MENRGRWAALVVGSAYVGIGVMSWLQLQPGGVSPVPSDMVLLALWAAILILALGLARTDFFQITTRETGPWLAVALAGPLALLSIRAGQDPSLFVFVVLWPLSALPLGISLGESPGRPDATWLMAGALTVAAVGLGGRVYLGDEPAAQLASLHGGLIGCIALVPALMAARRYPRRDPVQAGQVLIGLAPLAGAVILAVPAAGFMALLAALFAIVFVNRAALRPLARALSQARAQRDFTVATVESERRRLAADIHDGPLQSLLLLGRQLEEEGHTDAAANARSIAGELRDAAGELRLPLLDDLGVGPALDWLADRATRVTGAIVTVDYEGLTRPPPEVELAAFRIAQEALANAVRHGQPPIHIRYRTTGQSVSLSVDDAGDGFLRTSARGSGSHGLLNMKQRAEQIGARLEFLQLPDRGMHVGVEWPASG